MRYVSDTVPSLKGLADDVLAHSQEWEEWVSNEEPHAKALPGEWQERVGDGFGKLLVLKTFREEKLIFGCSQVGPK